MERLLTIRDVEQLTGFKKSSVYSFIEAGDFPKPIKTGRSSQCPRVISVTGFTRRFKEVDQLI